MNAFEITVTNSGTYLRIDVRGPGTLANLHRALQRIIVEAKAQDSWRVLVDTTGIEATVSSFDKYEIGVEFARVADRRMKLAVTGRPEAVDHFFETVARNRGGAVRVFTDESAALHWLLG